MIIDLSIAGKGNYRRGRSKFVILLWHFVEALILDNRLIPFSFVRIFVLRLFGARIGKGCLCPHAFRVKFPWNLELGDNVWIGDGVWFYNQEKISVGSNVCISQRTFISCGSHDYKLTMDLKVSPVVIEDGVWINSACFIQMGVVIGAGSLVTPMSVVSKSLESGWIYGGNPCVKIKKRFSD